MNSIHFFDVSASLTRLPYDRALSTLFLYILLIINVYNFYSPGMDSSLSSVPPVNSSPRPESIGIFKPHAARAGVNGSEVLSPTPPVLCLSTTKSRQSSGHVSVSPKKMYHQPDSTHASIFNTCILIFYPSHSKRYWAVKNLKRN
jgi:hypothetical protein